MKRQVYPDYQPNQPQYLAQGYPPQGQYQGQPPQHYGYQQPPPQVIIINNDDGGGKQCRVCGSRAGFTENKVIGGKIILWCLILLLCTFWCFFVPFLIDECYDREVVCINCGSVSHTIS